MTVHPANLKTSSPARPLKPGAEVAVALAGTAFAAVLVVVTAMYAGPLWRDEVNTINVAQMPSLREFWANMAFESFPPLWPLLLRLCGDVGIIGGSDAGIRVIGLYVGLLFLASLWACSRWTGGRAPILSVGLLGSLPAFVFIVGANRAYGLASCLLVLTFGMIWRVVEVPSKGRIFLAGVTCLLFAHCVYYDVVFLCAMLAGAAAVLIRRRKWKTLGALAGIGAVAGASTAIYLPIIHRGSVYAPMSQMPSFDGSTLWYKLGSALTARSSAHFPRFDGSEIWCWVLLVWIGCVVALMMQRRREPQTERGEATQEVRSRADLALFCVVSMLLGIVGYTAFLLKLHFITQSWYYVEMLCLCAISLDGLLGANRPQLRPWGLLRIGFMVVMMTWNARSAWEEAHTRRSNIDLVAAVLSQKASEGDLIVVQSAWEGITFDRYYHGKAQWVTLPPIDSHKVHRNDLVMEKMQQADPMAPVLREITDTLRKGNSVWIARHVIAADPKYVPPPPPPPPALPTKWWMEPYLAYWSAQVTVSLLDQARQERVLEIPVSGPVSHLEHFSLVQFSGYRVHGD